MYQVFKNKRALKSVNNQADFFYNGEGSFASYEKARQALRKYIRTMVKKGKAIKLDFKTKGAPWGWDAISRNPTNFTGAGFTIRKVA